MKLVDQEFHFKGFGNCASRCRVRIYEVPKGTAHWLQKLHAGDKVVILTQLEGENLGTSVTNASEIIVNAVAEQFKLEPLRTIWIEHYQDRNKGNVWKSVSEQETFDRVTYSITTGDITRRIKTVSLLMRPCWNHLTRDIVASLIGEEP